MIVRDRPWRSRPCRNNASASRGPWPASCGSRPSVLLPRFFPRRPPDCLAGACGHGSRDRQFFNAECIVPDRLNSINPVSFAQNPPRLLVRKIRNPSYLSESTGARTDAAGHGGGRPPAGWRSLATRIRRPGLSSGWGVASKRGSIRQGSHCLQTTLDSRMETHRAGVFADHTAVSPGETERYDLSNAGRSRARSCRGQPPPDPRLRRKIRRPAAPGTPGRSAPTAPRPRSVRWSRRSAGSARRCGRRPAACGGSCPARRGSR